MWLYIIAFTVGILSVAFYFYKKKAKSVFSKYVGKEVECHTLNNIYEHDITALNTILDNDLSTGRKKSLFIIQFGTVLSMRKQYNLLRGVMNPASDKLLIVINSGGGDASQFNAISSIVEMLCKMFNVHVFIDSIAASGGYMMAVPAHKIIAAPYAMIGSVGVIAQSLNYTKLLDKLGIEDMTVFSGSEKNDFNKLTTVDPKSKARTLEKCKIIHKYFIDHVKTHRTDAKNFEEAQIYISQEAKENNLIDEIMTYDEYVQQQIDSGYTVINMKTKNNTGSPPFKNMLKFVYELL
jgi:signal peptide peptidase SppA